MLPRQLGTIELRSNFTYSLSSDINSIIPNKYTVKCKKKWNVLSCCLVACYHSFRGTRCLVCFPRQQRTLQGPLHFSLSSFLSFPSPGFYIAVLQCTYYVSEHIPPSTNLFPIPISLPRFVQVVFQHKNPCHTQTLKRYHLLLAPPRLFFSRFLYPAQFYSSLLVLLPWIWSQQVLPKRL